MKLMEYREYWNILLNEENQKEVFERLNKAFPNEAEYGIYSAILNQFPSLNAKSIIASVLIRSRHERERANISPQQTQEAFTHLGELLKRNYKIDLAALLSKDKKDHPNDQESQLFTHFIELIHQGEAKIQAIDAKRLQKRSAVKIEKPAGEEEDEIKTKFPNPIYTDDNVEIYDSRTPAACQAYEGDSTICLKTPVHFWGSYRIPNASGFYFIFPKTPKNFFEDPAQRATRRRFLLVEVRKNGTCVWTFENNTMNQVSSINDILRLFPFLQAPAQQGIFKHREITPAEQENYIRTQNATDDNTFIQFSPAAKEMYIANQHKLSNRMWDSLSPDLKNEYVNVSLLHDLTDHQYEDVKKDPQLNKRYQVIKKRSLEGKIVSGRFDREGITKHEAAILPSLLAGMDENAKRQVTISLVNKMKAYLSGREVPQTDISGIYNLFKGQLLADPSMQTQELLQSVAEILGGSKTAQWKNLPPAVKESVYSVAMDLYNANPQKMQPIIDQSIRQNRGVLLQGLLDVPTEFQVKYFNEHRDELLNTAEFRDGLNQALMSHLVYGNILTGWLKNYWNAEKRNYLQNSEWMERLKETFQHMIYAKDGNKYPEYAQMPSDTKEIYNMLIEKVKNDPTTYPIAAQSVFDLVMNQHLDMNNVSEWPISKEFKRFYAQHKVPLAREVTYKIIDNPPENIPPQLAAVVEEFKDSVLADPAYRNKVENRLLADFVNETASAFKWSGVRIDYWLQHFWDILKRHPGAEEAMLKRVIKEYGKDRTANAWYTAYGLPFSFYQKHEKEILADPEAYKGLKQLVIDNLIWRNNPKASTAQAVKDDLSEIERDFYTKHKREFPEEVVSTNNRGR